jgi:hypothetical protein
MSITAHEPPSEQSPKTAPAPHRRDRLGGGAPLEPQTRLGMERQLGANLTNVRIHADRSSGRLADAAGAAAYAHGLDIVFAPGRYAPSTPRGLRLLAHELAHVVQQTGGSSRASSHASSDAQTEVEADRAGTAVSRGVVAPTLATPRRMQRSIELRDVGRGEQSGFDRRSDLIARLNAVSGGLTFSLDGANMLRYVSKPGAALSGFDRQMIEFIDAPGLIPLRLTTSQGLLGDPKSGRFPGHVDGDAWASGYVDIDDMLASDDLGFQVVMVHFLRERATTHDYARRIGTLNDSSPEFDAAHARGVGAEVRLLRDFFGDPTITLLADSHGDVFRAYRNSRGDVIRADAVANPQCRAEHSRRASAQRNADDT